MSCLIILELERGYIQAGIIILMQNDFGCLFLILFYTFSKIACGK